MPDDEDLGWMRRALRLAVRSLGRTAPNPGVGCVVVRGGQLLGEGRHERSGGPHAEVAALQACRSAGHDPAGATVYVTLAPCTSHGRTGACHAALIDAGVGRVVAAIADPSQADPAPVFADAGIAYAVGCCAREATLLHGGFLIRQRLGRPRLTGKWAMTLDGCIAAVGGHSAWISSTIARGLSRRRRRCYDAIVVGGGTARLDDPELLASGDVRAGPIRVVVSAHAELPPTARLLADRQVPVLLLHDARARAQRLADLVVAGVRTRSVDDARDPWAIAEALAEEGCNEVLVEGGSRVHHAFLEADLYDRLECYLGAKTVAGGVPVAAGQGRTRIPDQDQWELEGPPLLLGSSILSRWERRR